MSGVHPGFFFLLETLQSNLRGRGRGAELCKSLSMLIFAEGQMTTFISVHLQNDLVRQVGQSTVIRSDPAVASPVEEEASRRR